MISINYKDERNQILTTNVWLEQVNLEIIYEISL